MIRIFLVDDQNLVQQGIKSLLDRDLELDVVATVKDGRTAVKEIERLRPDIVLLDIEMPGMNGITTTKYISRVSPNTKVIILSSHEEKKYVTQALMAGAKGYILKSSLMTDLKQAIVAVNNGYSQVDSRLLAKVFDPSNLKPKKRQSTASKHVSTEKPNKSTARKSGSQPTNDLDENSTTIESIRQVNHNSETSEAMLQDRLGLSNSQHNNQLEWKELDKNNSSPSGQDSSKDPARDPLGTTSSEQDTLIQSNGVNSELRESENLETQSSDSVLAEGNDSAASYNLKKNSYDDYQKRLFNVKNKTNPVAANKYSDLQQYRLVKTNLSKVSSKKASTKNLVQRSLANLQSSQDSHNNTAQFQSKIERYKSKLISSIEKNRRKTWLWNIGLIVIGVAIVIIIGYF